MRALVFLLVFGNLLFFAFARGYFGQADNPDYARVVQQLQPEKVVIVARGDAPPPAAATPVAAPRPEVTDVCLQWDGLALAEAEKLAAAAAALAAGGPFERHVDSVARTRHWVRIGGLATRALAERKAAEAGKMGVRGHEVLADGEQWAVSMGVFSTREAADNHLADLRKKGIRSAVVADRVDAVDRLRLVWKGPALAADELRQAVKAVPVACAPSVVAGPGDGAPSAGAAGGAPAAGSSR